MQRLAHVALGLAVVLVVQRGEIQAQKRNIQNPGGCLCGETLAATLHADQHQPTRRLEVLELADESGAALLEPFLQILQAPDVGQARGIVLEREHAGAIQQLVLRPHDIGEITRRDGTVAIHGVVRDALDVGTRQPGEVLDQQLERLGVDMHATRIIAVPRFDDPVDDHRALVVVRQR